MICLKLLIWRKVKSCSLTSSLAAKCDRIDLILTCLDFLMQSIIKGISSLENPNLFNPVLNFR